MGTDMGPVNMSMVPEQSNWSFSEDTRAIKFDDFTIDILYFEGAPGKPWFQGKVVAEALGYTNTAQAVQTHVHDKFKKTLSQLIGAFGEVVSCHLGHLDSSWPVLTANNLKSMYLNESGLYALIQRSNKPNAVDFCMWVNEEVLPSIRRTGSYSVASTSNAPQLQWTDAFGYDVRALNEPGLYLHLMHDVALDEPATDRHIVGKLGKAVDQTIAKRNEAHSKLHPDNRLVYAAPAVKPGMAENRLKSMVRNKGWLRNGKYPDGKPGTEFLAFLPEEATELRSYYDIACEETGSPDILLQQEITKQAESKARIAEAEVRKLELQLELRKLDIEAARKATSVPAPSPAPPLSVPSAPTIQVRLPDTPPVVPVHVAVPTLEDAAAAPVAPAPAPPTEDTFTHFPREIYSAFLEARCERVAGAIGPIADLLHTFEKWVCEGGMESRAPMFGGSLHSMGYSASFKQEFIAVLAGLLNATYRGVSRAPKRKGFYGVRLREPVTAP